MDGDFYILKVTGYTNRLEVENYLPGNYRVLCEANDESIYVMGQDNAGWTAHGYVIPRLGSGLIYAEVVRQIKVIEVTP